MKFKSKNFSNCLLQNQGQNKDFTYNIFRAYDIRGLYPKEINESAAFLIGKAFVKFLKKKNAKIVVGRDNRLSSLPLFKGLVKGILSQGGKVIDIGLSTTPMLYWATAHYHFDGGIMITASHLGKEFNGFKMVREKAIPISEKSGLKEIKQITRLFSRAGFKPLKTKGKVTKKKILSEYLKFNFKEINPKEIKQLKIVVDTANAISGILIPKIKNKLPIEIYHLFSKMDGNFPHHSPDPLIKENLKFLQKEVKKQKAHFGIAFDGDGDRVFFLDEKGKIISGDLISAFLSQLILKKNPGAKILYDVRSSQIVPETIKENKGKPIVWKIGHSFIKEKMRKEDALFAGEFSGHYYHKEHYFAEAPLFVLFKILEVLSQDQKKFSGMLKPFKKYFHSGEINFKAKNKKDILRLLEIKYKSGKILKLDGLRIDFKDWWFLARPSGTEDLLRLVIGAKSKELMEEKVKELSSLIVEESQC